MPLKITLKPKERIIIDGAVIRNGSTTCNLFIENVIPILRQKDIMSEREAYSPCRRLYFVIQLMYLDKKNPETYYDTYWELVKTVLGSMPWAVGLIDQISEKIMGDNFYRALKLTRKLIDYEEGEKGHVSKSTSGIRPGQQNNPFGQGDRGRGPDQGGQEAQVLPGELACG